MTIGNTGRAALLAALAAGTLLLAGCDHGSSGGSYSNSGYSGGGPSGYSGGSRFTAQPPRGPYTPDY
jgi:hypothetical protein